MRSTQSQFKQIILLKVKAMATLEIHKAKTKSDSGMWFTFEVEQILIVRGEVLLVPKNKRYQYFKLSLSNCIIVK